MNNKTVVTVFLGILIFLGWQSVLFGGNDKNVKFNKLVTQADENYEKDLYQKAYIDYKGALEIKPSIEIQDKVIDAYEKFFRVDGGNASTIGLVNEIKEAIVKFPEETKYYEQGIELMLNTGDYDEALRIYKRSKKEKVKSDKISNYFKDIKSSFKELFDVTNEYIEFSNGRYIFKDYSGEYYFFDPKSQISTKKTYMNLKPINDDGIFATYDDSGVIKLINQDGIILSKIPGDFTDFGVFSEGLIPVKKNTWSYIDIDGKEVALGYESVSSFQNELAFVKNENEDWKVIDKEGSIKLEPGFSNVKFDHLGNYSLDGVMLAKKDGYFNLYDTKNFNKIGELNADDVDLLKSNLFAFKKKNKWGFANLKGEIVIEPEYEEAHSFNNGLAGVKINALWNLISEDKETIISGFEWLGYYNADGSIVFKSAEGEYKALMFNFPDLLK